MGEEHETCAWQDRFLPLIRPAEIDTRDGLVRVTSWCPRCKAPTVRDFELTLPGTKGTAADPAPGDVLGEIVWCDCDYPHAHRDPASRHQGCGAKWRIRT